MLTKFLIPSTILLISCSDGGQDISTPSPIKAADPAPIVQTANTLSPMERGAKLYKRCKACHTLDEGGKHKVGPNLWDVYGSKAGAKNGFNYSKVMAASDIVWEDATMDAYIKKPSEFMKGNRMSFIGIKKAEDREALLLYLKAETTP